MVKPEAWPHQTYAVERIKELHDYGVTHVCLTSPTGAGKTRIMSDLLEWATGDDALQTSALYTNRKMLTEQLAAALRDDGHEFGVRAAGFEELSNLDSPIQICSSQTEHSRVYRKCLRTLHDARLVLIDEIHLQKADVMKRIVADHAKSGAMIVGVTATPVEVNEMFPELVVAGRNSDLRQCGALLPARVYGPSELDTRHVKRTATGEYSVEEIRKKVWTHHIFGDVYKWWGILNPEKKPTILFAPGVAESIWFAKEFEKMGIRAAHIDGMDVYVDGEQRQSTREERDAILADVRTGKIPVVCNRFVMREGIDLPELFHLILATPIGSVVSYVQTVGRVLRNHSSLPGHVVVQDHGGNWWRHGSPNADRNWEDTYSMTAYQIGAAREEAMRVEVKDGVPQEPDTPEPIVCPECKTVRASGRACPVCNYVAPKRSRTVMMHDGQLVQLTGRAVKPRVAKTKKDTAEKWLNCYYRCKNSGKTFSQARGLFVYEHHYWPPSDLPMMPQRRADWCRAISEIQQAELL